MKDRQPLHPGRVKMTPVAGQENTFDMVMADEPTEAGDAPVKVNLLKDQTAALFGQGGDAVVDDVLHLLGNYIPTKYGLLIIRCTDAAGNPAAGTVTVSPAVEGSNFIIIGDRGYFSALVTPGTYTITAGAATIFEKLTVYTPSVTVRFGEPVIASVTAERVEHGEVDFTADITIAIPSWLTSIDLFGVGGGASGYSSIDNTSGTGGAGGHTTTLLNQNVAGKTLNIKIGAGGASSVSKYGTSSKASNAGGETSVTISGGSKILTANGGKPRSSSSLISDGGSGGGGYPTQTGSGTMSSAVGGSDGAAGTGQSAGNGQGSTTRKFGDPNGTLYAGGGAGASILSGNTYLGTPGSGGGAAYAHYYGTGSPPVTGKIHKGTDGQTYGSGGGACITSLKVADWDYDYKPECHSGAGKQGLVSIRW
ncbi:glycine-rich domain-containing protein [uncultured Dysosmobacter sp.]|uniref:glycine-rich domain-containing protein n=1 Tax=uncultured Dysosmobacter sp. TaxID=2591384 RepID=UPI00262909FE|nr:hypothetical protein [uncultured Dysosmobacter sp.]